MSHRTVSFVDDRGPHVVVAVRAPVSMLMLLEGNGVRFAAEVHTGGKCVRLGGLFDRLEVGTEVDEAEQLMGAVGRTVSTLADTGSRGVPSRWSRNRGGAVLEHLQRLYPMTW